MPGYLMHFTRHRDGTYQEYVVIAEDDSQRDDAREEAAEDEYDESDCLEIDDELGGFPTGMRLS